MWFFRFRKWGDRPILCHHWTWKKSVQAATQQRQHGCRGGGVRCMVRFMNARSTHHAIEWHHRAKYFSLFSIFCLFVLKWRMKTTKFECNVNPLGMMQIYVYHSVLSSFVAFFAMLCPVRCWFVDIYVYLMIHTASSVYLVFFCAFSVQSFVLQTSTSSTTTTKERAAAAE